VEGSLSWSADRLGDPGAEPLVVFIHGGFWRAEYGADTIAPLAHACAAAGIAVWNIEYPRVGMPGGGWPGTAMAVREAVGSAVAEAAGRSVALVGHSAGGHLALWAAKEHPVALAVSLAGVADLRGAAAAGLGNDAVAEFMGSRAGDPAMAAADPMMRLPLGVSTLLIHGDADDRVPIEQSRVYAESARLAGDTVALCELPGIDHFKLVDPAGEGCAILRDRLGHMPSSAAVG
jgi:acetyl esterase/lipase